MTMDIVDLDVNGEECLCCIDRELRAEMVGGIEVRQWEKD